MRNSENMFLTVLKEAKQVGKIYHATSYEGLQGILSDNTMKSNFNTGISFTRDPRFVYSDYPFILVFDGDAISEQHKVNPFDFFANSRLARSERETIVHPGGTKDLDLSKLNRSDFLEKPYELKNANKYIIGFMVNPQYMFVEDWVTPLFDNSAGFEGTPLETDFKNRYEAINSAIRMVKHYCPNAEIRTPLQRVQETTLKEGDKKIFDKSSGYNISEDELYIYNKLKEIFPNVQMSVTDDRFVNPDTRRHFQLDLYDPDTDTGFNYNKHIKHGRRKYNPEDPYCQADVKWLESEAKPGNFYEKILHTWKDLDPLKREIARENGLNFIEWFNIDEFNRWLENPNLTYEEYKYAPKSMQYDSDEYFDQKDRHRDIYGNDSKWDE